VKQNAMLGLTVRTMFDIRSLTSEDEPISGLNEQRGSKGEGVGYLFLGSRRGEELVSKTEQTVELYQ